MKYTFVLLTILIIQINLVDDVKADPSSIIIENADAIVENNLANSTDLNGIAQDVDPRIVVEYADVIVENDLANSTDLDDTAQDVDPRIIVEYADALINNDLVNLTGYTPSNDTIPPTAINDLRVIELTKTGFIYPVGKSEPYIYAGWLATNESNPPYYDGFYHIGQDMEAEVGDPVFAITDGEIIYVSVSGWGVSNYGLLLKHKTDTGQEFLALYGHIRPILQDLYYLHSGYVNPSIPVKAGEIFATIGPYNSMPHLHFGVRPGSDVPPAPWGRQPMAIWSDANGFINPMDWITTKTPNSPIDPTDSIILSWTAPGDDENNGTASGYIVKYSSVGPITDSNWNSATLFTQSWKPLEAGKTEVQVVSNLNPNTEYWFAIKTYDEALNLGEISNSLSGKTLSRPEESLTQLVPSYHWLFLILILSLMSTIVFLNIRKKIFVK